jgi:2-dehydro-3-deoxyphosphogluconate aldolase/(4S)-4-hydroxy-2-oxoglutarate aldolase
MVSQEQTHATYRHTSPYRTRRCVVGTRGAFPPEHALKMVETMVEMGFTNFEFTMNSEQPIEAMQAVKREYGDDVLVAMGTVLDTETAQRVIDAGVDFIVSPAFQPSVVEYVLGQGIFMAPGVVTPSECVAAWEIGVPLLKLFPIGALGIDYFKAIYGPLSHMKFMCNGAVNAENARQFIGAGRGSDGYEWLAKW